MKIFYFLLIILLVLTSGCAVENVVDDQANEDNPVAENSTNSGDVFGDNGNVEPPTLPE